MDLLDDIGDKLIADGVVDGTSGWKLYKSYLADDPDLAIAIYELPGADPDQTPGIAYEYPSFQVYVRGSEHGYAEARTKMKEVYNNLNNADVEGYIYIYATDSGPLLEEYDAQSNRPVLYLSFKTMKLPDSGNVNISVPSASMGAVGSSPV